MNVDYWGVAQAGPRGRTIFYATGNNSISLHTDNFYSGSYNDSAFLTAAHEAFHHFDSETVDLFRGPEVALPTPFNLTFPQSDHRMPMALKEGLANVMKLKFEPYPPSNYLGGFEFVLCLFAGNADPRCWADELKLFRKPATTGANRAYGGMFVTGTNNRPWADCRIAGASNLCHVVRRPGTPLPVGSQAQAFAWSGVGGATYNSFYRTIPQIVLDAWESSATVAAFAVDTAAGQTVADVYPDVVVRAFMALQPSASFFDFQAAVRVALTIELPAGTNLLVRRALDRELTNVFERHGLDENMRRYCTNFFPNYCN